MKLYVFMSIRSKGLCKRHFSDPIDAISFWLDHQSVYSYLGIEHEHFGVQFDKRFDALAYVISEAQNFYFDGDSLDYKYTSGDEPSDVVKKDLMLCEDVYLACSVCDEEFDDEDEYLDHREVCQ